MMILENELLMALVNVVCSSIGLLVVIRGLGQAEYNQLEGHPEKSPLYLLLAKLGVVIFILSTYLLLPEAAFDDSLTPVRYLTPGIP